MRNFCDESLYKEIKEFRVRDKLYIQIVDKDDFFEVLYSFCSYKYYHAFITNDMKFYWSCEQMWSSISNQIEPIIQCALKD